MLHRFIMISLTQIYSTQRKPIYQKMAKLSITFYSFEGSHKMTSAEGLRVSNASCSCCDDISFHSSISGTSLLVVIFAGTNERD